jgi:hypothetical protein
MKTVGELIDWLSAKVQGSNELTRVKEKMRSTELTKVIIVCLVLLVCYMAFCKGGGGGYRR